MPVPVSSLSIAVQGIADFLDTKLGEDVLVSTDSPLRASERAKSVAKHMLNLFVYRVIPSGFDADATSKEPLFIRIHALLTPFLADVDNPASDADLRILGNAIRILHGHPVIPTVLPGDGDAAGDFRHQSHLDYRLQSVLLAPTMEELNHIWTTQGGELAYRLSAAYEFAVIPVEPLEHAEPAPPFTTGIVDVKSRESGDKVEGFIPYGDEASTFSTRPPSGWRPIVLFSQDGVLHNSVTIPQGTDQLDVAIAGFPGTRVGLSVAWVREDESEDTQPMQVTTLNTHLIDNPNAITSLLLTNAAEGDKAIVRTQFVDENDAPATDSGYANTLSISVGAPV